MGADVMMVEQTLLIASVKILVEIRYNRMKVV